MLKKHQNKSTTVSSAQNTININFKTAYFRSELKFDRFNIINIRRCMVVVFTAITCKNGIFNKATYHGQLDTQTDISAASQRSIHTLQCGVYIYIYIYDKIFSYVGNTRIDVEQSLSSSSPISSTASSD